MAFQWASASPGKLSSPGPPGYWRVPVIGHIFLRRANEFNHFDLITHSSPFRHHDNVGQEELPVGGGWRLLVFQFRPFELNCQLQCWRCVVLCKYEYYEGPIVCLNSHSDFATLWVAKPTRRIKKISRPWTHGAIKTYLRYGGFIWGRQAGRQGIDLVHCLASLDCIFTLWWRMTPSLWNSSSEILQNSSPCLPIGWSHRLGVGWSFPLNNCRDAMHF